jgi:hypothetical protein
MRRSTSFAVLALALAACVTTPIGAATSPSGSVSIPSTSLNLGDWRRANANAIVQQFEREVAGRYGVGLALGAVSSDLRRNEFNCAANRETGGRGDPPDQICRRTITSEGCTHTWQVHLFSEGANAALARTRVLYDRRCGGDGLLGGPS